MHDNNAKRDQISQNIVVSEESRGADQMSEVPTVEQDAPVGNNRDIVGNFETLSQNGDAQQKPSNSVESVPEQNSELKPAVSLEAAPEKEGFTDWLPHHEPALDAQQRQPALGAEEWPGNSSFPDHVGNGSRV